MPGAGFGRASGIAWEEYYRAIEGRPLLTEAGAFPPSPGAGDGPRTAIDLGCGDGGETLALLAGGWRVVAVDGAAEAIVRLRASVPPDQAARLTSVVGRFQRSRLPRRTSSMPV